MSEAVCSPDEYIQTLAAPIKRAGGMGVILATVDIHDPKQMRLCISSVRAWNQLADGFIREFSKLPGRDAAFESAVRWLDDSDVGGLMRPWRDKGVAGLVLLRHTLIRGKTVDVFVPATARLSDPQMDAVTRAIFSNWPGLRSNVLRPMSGLSEEQISALEYSMIGYTASQTAEVLRVTTSAVEKRLENAREKLAARSTTQAVAKASWLGAL